MKTAVQLSQGEIQANGAKRRFDRLAQTAGWREGGFDKQRVATIFMSSLLGAVREGFPLGRAVVSFVDHCQKHGQMTPEEITPVAVVLINQTAETKASAYQDKTRSLGDLLAIVNVETKSPSTLHSRLLTEITRGTLETGDLQEMWQE